jgi:hypothetical protein
VHSVECAARIFRPLSTPTLVVPGGCEDELGVLALSLDVTDWVGGMGVCYIFSRLSLSSLHFLFVAPYNFMKPDSLA